MLSLLFVAVWQIIKASILTNNISSDPC